MGKVDLHVHTTASDGRLSPADVVRKSAELGLTVIAIADHDTVDGIEPALVAAKAFPGFRMIPSVEISANVPEGEAHLLGYFVDYTDSELKATLKELRNSRVVRAQRMIAKLRDLGIHVDWGRVQELAGTGAIGRPHVAQAMLEKGYITSLKEAFVNYIGKDGPAYIEREKMTPVEVVELILRARGLPVLAHPLTVGSVEMIVVELKVAGLAGIEAYYNGYTVDQVKRLVNLANKYGLIASGGSDYHGLDDSAETMIGGVNVPVESVERLVALAQERGLKLASS